MIVDVVIDVVGHDGAVPSTSTRKVLWAVGHNSMLNVMGSNKSQKRGWNRFDPQYDVVIAIRSWNWGYVKTVLNFNRYIFTSHIHILTLEFDSFVVLILNLEENPDHTNGFTWWCYTGDTHHWKTSPVLSNCENWFSFKRRLRRFTPKASLHSLCYCMG